MNNLPSDVINNFDFIIIGGSFVGLAVAKAINITNPNWRIAIIDQRDFINSKTPSDQKALAISKSTIDFLKEIELLDEDFLKNQAPISSIIIDDEEAKMLQFIANSTESNGKNFGYIIDSSILYQQITKKIIKLQEDNPHNICFYCPNQYHKIEIINTATTEEKAKEEKAKEEKAKEEKAKEEKAKEEKVVVTLDNSAVIQGNILIACDGRGSGIRRYFNIPTISKDYHQQAILFRITHEKPHNNRAWEKFYPGGPIAILPLPDISPEQNLANQDGTADKYKNQYKNQSSIVWIATNEKANILNKLDSQQLKNHLQHNIFDDVGEIEYIGNKLSYGLHLIESDCFYHKKILLMGDSAVAISPIAGQGLNLALKSVALLKEMLIKQISQNQIIDEQFLKTYQRKFKIIAGKMIIATDLLNSLFETNNPVVKGLRKLGLAIVNKSNLIKQLFIKGAGG
jgi:ubiquinone biosynthesis UbiH/UbiF/VisC/COQ6 family hydroxylase